MARNAVHVVGTVPVSGTVTANPASGTIDTLGTITNPVPTIKPRGTHVVAAKTVATTSAELLAADANRVYLAIANNSAFLIVVHDAAGTPTATFGIPIAPGQVWEPDDVPTGQINAICTLGGGTEPCTVETR